MREVNREHLNGYAANWREAHEQGAVPLEMLFPPVPPRVEQLNDVAAITVYSSNV